MEEFLELIKDIRFTEVDEFYRKKDYIKIKYQELDKSTKEVYKWYFYFQFCLLKNPLKELLWNYLNQEQDIFLSVELDNQYNLFCNKRKRQKQEEIEIDNYWE